MNPEIPSASQTPPTTLPSAVLEHADKLTAKMQTAHLWMPSWIWLIPVLAILIAGWLVFKQISARGPVIEIRFSNAEGLEAGKTRVKYKSVDIGVVRALRLSEDHRAVIVTAELDKSASAFLAQDSRFWVVRPRITAGEISGLGTLLAGIYIAADIGKAQETHKSFVGLDVPPIISSDSQGRQFILHASDLGSLDIGSPLYYRRVEVGEVVAYAVDANGKGVSLTLFVHAPYDKYVSEQARFWHASGIDVAFDANGIRVNTQSLASIIAGGIAFDNLEDDSLSKPAPANTHFDLQANRQEAFRRPDGRAYTFVLYFPHSVRGLSIGAPIDFRGIVIGEVRHIGVELNDKTLEHRFPVSIDIYPERLRRYAKGQMQQRSQVEMRNLLDHLVTKGLRAQLRTSSLLTGQLYVAVDFFPDAKPIKIDWSQRPLALPTVVGRVEDLQNGLQVLVHKLEKMPLNEMLGELRQTFGQLNQTLMAVEKLANQGGAELVPPAKQTLLEIQKTMQGAQQLLASEAPLQQDLRQTLQALTSAAQALTTMAELLEREPQAILRGRSAPERLPYAESTATEGKP